MLYATVSHLQIHLKSQVSLSVEQHNSLLGRKYYTQPEASEIDKRTSLLSIGGFAKKYRADPV
jgi:hypothetical protein